MSSVLLVVHPERREATLLAAAARAWWEAHGYDVTTVGGTQQVEPSEIAGAGSAFDFAVSLGGDGTMLRTVQLALPGGTAVLGVNLGRMGYLTEVEPAGIETAFERLVSGDFHVEERMALEVSTLAGDDGTGARQFVALNEALVEKTAPGHTIRVEVHIAGRRFLTYVADGLLACTPTGSTAYNLSARGPVVSPRLRAMVLTPVAPHLLFDRSLVLEPDETLCFTLLDGRAASLVLDGCFVATLVSGDSVECRGAEEPARLVTFGERDFHALLRTRFGLTDR